MTAAALYAHLAGGVTTVCRAWAVVRRDGVTLGFTDHDRDLAFAGITFRADTGMSARALQQTTGLSVDNTEAVGALSSAAVTEADLIAGRFDAAEVRAWLVNWVDVAERVLQFRGTMGEITRAGGAFRADLRGLSEALNQAQGRVYQRNCGAILGDTQCRFDLQQPGFFAEVAVEAIAEQRLFRFPAIPGVPDRRFDAGRFRVLSGTAQSLTGAIKTDRTAAGYRTVELRQRIGAEMATGDRVRLEAGCDKRAETCRQTFNNFANFRGFPHVPGEDWLISYPISAGVNDGGSLS